MVEVDTDRVDMMVQILDQLALVNQRLTNIESDVALIRHEQVKAGRRLQDVEEACAPPLRSATPPPRPVKGSSGNGGWDE